MHSNTASDFGILEGVRDVAMEACEVPAGDRGVGEWMELIAEVSAAMSVLTAARDAAVVRLAAIEEVVTEDGVIGEQVNGLGTVCVDAAAMVSTAAGVTTRFGQELVEAAVLRVVRVPALHAAMLAGGLDEYRARCVGGELVGVPADLARVVVDALAVEFTTRSGPALRRRAREMLTRLAPELLRERIRKARAAVGVQRWSGEPGTQCWGAVFPSERSARAWAAVDALAREYRAEGRYATLEQARAYALLDLVDGRASVETVLHVTVAADALTEARAGRERSDGGAVPGATSSSSSAPPTSASPPLRSSAAAAGGGVALTRPEASAVSSEAGCAGGERFVTVLLPGGGEQLAWMPVSVLPSDVAGVEWGCDPETGAVLDIGDALAGEGYRPARKLRRLVRRRDRRCRFPGCVVPARQCDLDHVIPWPAGPTAAWNLMCLCRRHHRVKQRHRWRVWLEPDGVVWWVDPSGRRLRTDPVDQLRTGQVQVTDIEAATPDDVAELREMERLSALYDRLTGNGELHDALEPEHEHADQASRDRPRQHGRDDAGGDWGDWGALQSDESGAVERDDSSASDERDDGSALDERDDGSAIDERADGSAIDERADGSAIEAALAGVVADLVRSLTTAEPTQPAAPPAGHQPTEPAAHPAATVSAPARPRTVGNPFDANRIPRPSQPGYSHQDRDDHDRGGSREQRTTGRSECNNLVGRLEVFDFRARHRHVDLRYRPSKRHRRRVAYLAAGGPPF